MLWVLKKPTQSDGSFEHPKHMLKLMGKEIITLIWDYDKGVKNMTFDNIHMRHIVFYLVLKLDLVNFDNLCC